MEHAEWSLSVETALQGAGAHEGRSLGAMMRFLNLHGRRGVTCDGQVLRVSTGA
jgi:hypothetical protein